MGSALVLIPLEENVVFALTALPHLHKLILSQFPFWLNATGVALYGCTQEVPTRGCSHNWSKSFSTSASAHRSKASGARGTHGIAKKLDRMREFLVSSDVITFHSYWKQIEGGEGIQEFL